MIDDIYRRFHESIPLDALCGWEARRDHHHNSFTIRYWRNVQADIVSLTDCALDVSPIIQIESSDSILTKGENATMVSDAGFSDLESKANDPGAVQNV